MVKTAKYFIINTLKTIKMYFASKMESHLSSSDNKKCDSPTFKVPTRHNTLPLFEMLRSPRLKRERILKEDPDHFP